MLLGTAGGHVFWMSSLLHMMCLHIRFAHRRLFAYSIHSRTIVCIFNLHNMSDDCTDACLNVASLFAMFCNCWSVFQRRIYGVSQLHIGCFKHAYWVFQTCISAVSKAHTWFFKNAYMVFQKLVYGFQRRIGFKTHLWYVESIKRQEFGVWQHEKGTWNTTDQDSKHDKDSSQTQTSHICIIQSNVTWRSEMGHHKQ